MKFKKKLKDGVLILFVILLLPILVPLLYLTPLFKKTWPFVKSLAFFVWWFFQGLCVSALGLIFLQSFLKEKGIEPLGFVLIFFASLIYAIIKLTKYIRFHKVWSYKKKELPRVILDKLRNGASLSDLYASTIYSDEFRNPYEYYYPHIVTESLLEELGRLENLKLDLNNGEEWQNESFDQEWYDKVCNELKNIGAINKEINDSKISD